MPSAVDSPATNTGPFPAGYRASGLLLHVTSLPSPYGIGDLGPSAYAWIDRLADAGQSWWQALPFGPTGYGDSPYQGLSSFVGNGLLISPELLIEDGLLKPDECADKFSNLQIDYHVVIPFKQRLLHSAWTRFKAGARSDLFREYEEFCNARAGWLEDYALFRALKAAHDGVHYLRWPAELVERKPAAMASARAFLADEIDQVRLAQFLLNRQAKRLKAYARSKGVGLIGDLPFYVSPDSSDVWANPELFLVDHLHRPRFVAGAPPDSFNDKGQLWGNPVYNWDALKDTGYAWCIERIKALLAHVELIRLDHFRAFAAGWYVSAGAPDARNGEWIPGPGAPFFEQVRNQLGVMPFIAEDLGFITPDVVSLRDQFQIPGTRVLQFGFETLSENLHLPHNCSDETVVYTGTHDNPTTRQWFEELAGPQRRRFWTYVGRTGGELSDAASELIRMAWFSRSALAIAPVQDLLNIGKQGRMNVPGQTAGNWRWRVARHTLSSRNFRWLRDLTNLSARHSGDPLPIMEVAS